MVRQRKNSNYKVQKMYQIGDLKIYNVNKILNAALFKNF